MSLTLEKLKVNLFLKIERYLPGNRAKAKMKLKKQKNFVKICLQKTKELKKQKKYSKKEKDINSKKQILTFEIK